MKNEKRKEKKNLEYSFWNTRDFRTIAFFIFLSSFFFCVSCQNETPINNGNGNGNGNGENGNGEYVEVIINNYGGLPVDAVVRDGRRPIPVSPISGTGYDELLFYERTGYAVFDENNQWRKDAWARIEQIRKGDFTVNVKDEYGNSVNGAEVKVNMYEHEFRWGTAINGNILTTSANHPKYRAGVSLLFNAGVLENGHKWNYYENVQPGRARSEYNAAKEQGLSYMRGHTLIWDYSFPSGWTENNSIPLRIYNLFTAENKSGLDSAIKAHFNKIAGVPPDGFRGQVECWDVLNEAMENRAMQNSSWYNNGNRYSVIKNWFDWAREAAGQETQLFINETGLDAEDTVWENGFAETLENMQTNDVDFDGIGIQGHFRRHSGLNPTTKSYRENITPESFYQMLGKFNKFDKIMTLTEFDIQCQIIVGEDQHPDSGVHNDDCANGTLGDRQWEAGFTRDIMIAVFSHPNMNGFYMWGFWSGSHWESNAPVFNADWSLKESGKQYIDLVYNKWRTRESGITETGGTYNFRGFYGDYDITVSHNGKTKTVQASFNKGGNNSVTVTLE